MNLRDGGSATFQRVGSLAALRKGGNFAVMVGGRRLAVFEVGGEVVVTQGQCPHAKGPLHDGDVKGRTLTCPWHGYAFSLDSGACDDDPELTLERYTVRVDGDDILVRL